MTRFDEKYLERSKESWDKISPEEFLGYLLPKAEQILTLDGLKEKLLSGEKLGIKLGIDPTGKDIHLGHLVPIIVLRQFLRAGHKVHLIIGDFTAQVGDPSGRTASRKSLTSGDIKENQKTYIAQIDRYIKTSKLKIHHNSDWLEKVKLNDFFGILEKISLSDATQRDDFRNRLKNGQGVSLAEVCYGILMAIDSVELKTDIEVGGVDQLLNFQQARQIMPLYGLKEEVAFTVPILEGTSGDGRKMSKSFDNYIAVTASSEEKFGKIMSIPDKLILSYFISFADVHEREIGELKEFIAREPMEAKKQLATFIASLEFGDLKKGLEEREKFERKFSKDIISDADCVEIKIKDGATILEVLFETGQFESKGEIRRLFNENSVRILADDKILGLDFEPSKGEKIRVGKRKFFIFH